jgi:GT2 family glycosyltransferase
LIDTVIITPTLGNRPSLAQTVDSVRRIGGPRVKHVLVCPSRAAGSLKQSFPHCEVLAEKEKSGVFGAVNFGMRTASTGSEFIGYINDDDCWLPEFSRLFELLTKSQEVDIAYGRVLFVDAESRPVYESTSTSRFLAFRHLLARGPVIVAQQSALMRTRVLEKLGGFSSEYSLIADTDFWLRATESKLKFEYLDAPCATFMMHPGQLSSDRSLSDIEMAKLFQQHGITKDWRSFVELIRFRIENLPRYLSRCVNRRSVHIEQLMRGGKKLATTDESR